MEENRKASKQRNGTGFNEDREREEVLACDPRGQDHPANLGEHVCRGQRARPYHAVGVRHVRALEGGLLEDEIAPFEFAAAR